MASSLANLPPGVDLNLVPMAVNPSGALPNFIDPPSLASTVAGVGVTFAILASIAVLAKTASDLKSPRGFWLDTVCSLFALTVAHAYLGVTLSDGNTMKHMWDLPVTVLTSSYVKKTVAAGMLYGVSAWANKTAILLVLHRVFRPVMMLRVFIYVGIAMVSVVHLSSLPVYGVLCTPRKGEHWDIALLSGRCSYPTSLHTIIVGACGTALDIYIWILPLPSVIGLHLALRKKIGLVSIFMAGIFAITASVVALYYRVKLFRGTDVSWNSANAVVCVFVEGYVTLIVGCAPSMAAMWHNSAVFRSSFASSLRTIFASDRSSRGKSSIDDSPSKTGLYEVPYPASDNSERRLRQSDDDRPEQMKLEHQYRENSVPGSLEL